MTVVVEGGGEVCEWLERCGRREEEGEGGIEYPERGKRKKRLTS